MTDYELMSVILTFGLLIVSIIALCIKARNQLS
ncbi:MAG: putative holin-like toxin [Saccharofermentans sp.]|nr:putative holin-like toxin [Saccharofermentans sp.]